MKHKIYTSGDIKIKAYNNGSYGYYLEDKGWRNIPHELGKKLVKLFAIPNVVNRRELLLAYLKYQNRKDYQPETRMDDEIDKFLSQ